MQEKTEAPVGVPPVLKNNYQLGLFTMLAQQIQVDLGLISSKRICIVSK